MAKGAPEPQQSGQDNSLDFLWMMAIGIAAIFLAWYLGKTYITTAVFKVKLYEIAIVNFAMKYILHVIQLLGFAPPEYNLPAWSEYIKLHLGVPEDFGVLVQLFNAVGYYLRFPFVILIFIGALYVYLTSTTYKFRHTFNTDSLKAVEQQNWPQIVPVAKLDLIKQDLDAGPWAFSLSPLRFCKKNNLLDVKFENGRYIATLRRGPAYRILSLQLGPRWTSPLALPIHLKALFGIFAARINGEKKQSEMILDHISASAAGTKLDFTGAEEFLRKYMNTKPVGQIVARHGYVTTVFASMLVAAREVGVLATAEFIWLKPLDRRMWYVLNGVGRPTPVSEVCGAFAHWSAERKLGLPLKVPMVEEAVRGLDLALNDIVYKPDEADD